MERLTVKTGVYQNGKHEIIAGMKCGVEFKDIFDRLAAYEDTGLEPETIEEIYKEWSYYLNFVGKRNTIEDAVDDIYDEGKVDYDRLHELAQADREGRCVVFQPGYAVVSIYNPADEDGLYTMKVAGVITKEEYEAALRREQDG